MFQMINCGMLSVKHNGADDSTLRPHRPAVVGTRCCGGADTPLSDRGTFKSCCSLNANGGRYKWPGDEVNRTRTLSASSCDWGYKAGLEMGGESCVIMPNDGTCS